jgi:hypothetical protein
MTEGYYDHKALGPLDRFDHQGHGIPENEYDTLMRYIKTYWKNNRHSPTYREMQQFLRLSSVNLIYRRMKVLERRGKIIKAGHHGVIPTDMKVVFDD